MPQLILVVDDEPKVARLARDYLEKNGFRVIVAANGQSALAIARREKPDLVVLDLMLPGIDGLDVCRAIRRGGPNVDAPILMLTAEVGVHAAFLIQNVDFFYFTGTLQTGYLFVPKEGEALFLVQKDYARARLESPLACVKIGSIKDLPGLLRVEAKKGKRIGMELVVIPVALFDRIRGLFPDWEVHPVSAEIKEARSVKSNFELEQIRRSGEMITQVFSAAKNHLREGMTELELDGILVAAGRTLGHQGFLRMRGLNQEMMNIQVVSGESGSVTSFCDTPLCGRGTTPAVAQGSS